MAAHVGALSGLATRRRVLRPWRDGLDGYSCQQRPSAQTLRSALVAPTAASRLAFTAGLLPYRPLGHGRRSAPSCKHRHGRSRAGCTHHGRDRLRPEAKPWALTGWSPFTSSSTAAGASRRRSQRCSVRTRVLGDQREGQFVGTLETVADRPWQRAKCGVTLGPD